MRQILVPPGTVRTKPRALNYALDFCRGSIVGVYDAEDAPAPDQLRRVVRRFRESPPEVACLQGVLDFYNARTNWLSRCFTIDYATWFRIVLPGIARLGFVIPLGGTTLFFRRAALERLGGWDAHNVTEDADLGLRLARHGYRCELIDSVTEEEANCRAIPWIRQRSRWLKGYALTWISHMRRPGLLLRDLGLWKFMGVQILFLGTLSTFLLAPLVWSFWLLPFGLPHPLAGIVPWWLFVALGSAFLLTELVNIAASAVAVSSAKHRWLIPRCPRCTSITRSGRSPRGRRSSKWWSGRSTGTRPRTASTGPNAALSRASRLFRVVTQTGLERDGDMLLERAVGRIAVTGGNRVHDLLMLGEGDRAPPFDSERVVAISAIDR
jgi:glycosyltransferase XagB